MALLPPPMVLIKPTLLHHQVLHALINELQVIDFKAVAGLKPDEPLKRNHQLIITNEQLLITAKKKDWALCVNENQVYLYNGEYWHHLSRQELNSFLGSAAEKLGINLYDARYHGFKTELVKQFMSSAYLPKPQKQGNEVLINLQNGTFAITPADQSIRAFDRGDFITYQLPFAFDDTATAPIFSDYLNTVLPDPKLQMILAEYVGYIFVKQKTLKLEKTLILYGSGANGKSVFFEILNALLGPQNVSNYSLQSLADDKGYHRAMLGGKLLNYASEISPNMNVTIFKQLVSGEQIEARLPRCEPFTLEDYAKFIFNTNELPKDVEHNEAFYRRFLIIHFGITIPEQDRDPELPTKIIQNELAGVFNWMLEGLKRLLLNKKFTQSDAVDDMLKSYRLSSDSVQLFIVELGYEANNQEETSLSQMQIEYKQYCMDAGFRPCSRPMFTDRLRKAGFDTHRKNTGWVVFAGKKTII